MSNLEISAKYQGYIDRQAEEVARSGSFENTVFPESLDYAKVAGLSNEVKQKLNQHRPQTIGQASRVQGITLQQFHYYLFTSSVSACQKSMSQAKLCDWVAAMGLVVPEPRQEQLLNFQALLLKWNKTYNLTASGDP